MAASPSATVEVVEDTGPARILLARWGSMKLHLLARRDLEARPGDELRPKIDASRIVVSRE